MQQHPSTPNSIHRHPTTHLLGLGGTGIGIRIGRGRKAEPGDKVVPHCKEGAAMQCSTSIRHTFCTTCVGRPQCNAIRPLSILVLVPVVVTITAIRALVWVALQYDGDLCQKDTCRNLEQEEHHCHHHGFTVNWGD